MDLDKSVWCKCIVCNLQMFRSGPIVMFRRMAPITRDKSLGGKDE